MKWIDHYQLFLFDFDGILVDTEKLHFVAYQQMCARRGFSLNWDMKTYLSYAMFQATALKEGIYRTFPDLEEREPNWDVLYREKKDIYAELIRQGVPLVEGVAVLLQAIHEAKIPACVVTHSSKEHLAPIRRMHPLLDQIPHWITREDYKLPKPSSECYQKAIELFAKKGDRVIGFEDSPRGLEALLGVEAEAVWITPFFTQDAVAFNNKPFECHPSFASFYQTR